MVEPQERLIYVSSSRCVCQFYIDYKVRITMNVMYSLYLLQHVWADLCGHGQAVNILIKEKYFKTYSKCYTWHLVCYFKKWNNKKRIKIEYIQDCAVEIFGFALDVACCLKHLALFIRSTLNALMRSGYGLRNWCALMQPYVQSGKSLWVLWLTKLASHC